MCIRAVCILVCRFIVSKQSFKMEFCYRPYLLQLELPADYEDSTERAGISVDDRIQKLFSLSKESLEKIKQVEHQVVYEVLPQHIVQLSRVFSHLERCMFHCIY